MSKTFVTVTEEVSSHGSVEFSTVEKPQRQTSAKFATSMLLLRDPALYVKYHKFQQSQVNYFSLFMLLLYSSLTVFLSCMTYVEYPSIYSMASIFVSVVLVVFSAVVTCAVRLWCRQPSDSVCQWIAFLDSTWLFGLSIYTSLDIVITVLNGRCINGYKYGCVISADGIDGDRMVSAMTTPVLFFLVVRSAKWEVVLSTYLVNIVTILSCIFYADFDALASFLFVLPFTALALYEYQRQILNLFQMHVKQEIIQEENDRLAEEAHSTELRHMIGNVAHDLKTPLSAFVCGVELIKSLAEEIKNSIVETEVLNKEFLSDSITSILENAVNVINTNSFMLMTINRCIDYTKASKNMKLTPRLETFNLQEAINLPMHCMKDLQSDRVHIGAVPLMKSISPFIITDKQWLQENILCLLSNAVKYSSHGMVMLSVSLTFHEFRVGEKERSHSSVGSGNFRPVLRVEVEDTGIGLTDEVMANLFKPFKQAQRLAGGTGLGLFSLAKRMEALGGWYGVQKRRDGQQGSIFWFEIPYRPDEEASQNAVLSSQSSSILPTKSEENVVVRRKNVMKVIEVKASAPKVVTPKRFNEGALNILIVDDSPSILKMSSKMLEKQGYNITTAEDGAQALDVVIENKQSGARKFDCVLMDLQMPVMDGLEATMRIRKFENSCGEGGRLMIIGVSANSDTETMNDAYKAGVDAFIPKPFNFKLFNEEYNAMCERRLLARV